MERWALACGRLTWRRLFRRSKGSERKAAKKPPAAAAPILVVIDGFAGLS
jgi:hypothetical protein